MKDTNVLAITNQKGGVGKTTTAVNLSASLSKLGHRVCLIDSDPQGNATHGCGVLLNQKRASLSNLLIEKIDVKTIIWHTSFGFDLIPSQSDLTIAEVRLLNADNKPFVLKEALMPIMGHYDYIIIDCPPTLNILTINALVASQSALIPVQCEYYAMEGVAGLMNSIRNLQQSLACDIRISGVLRTMYDGRNRLAREVSMQLQHHFQDLLFHTIIPRNVKLAEAPSHGKPIYHYDRLAQGTSSYLALANELDRRLKHKQLSATHKEQGALP